MVILDGNRLRKHQSRKQISIIVDADDKNGLAQLTVARKLNQVLSFAQAKGRTYNSY